MPVRPISRASTTETRAYPRLPVRTISQVSTTKSRAYPRDRRGGGKQSSIHYNEESLPRSSHRRARYASAVNHRSRVYSRARMDSKTVMHLLQNRKGYPGARTDGNKAPVWPISQPQKVGLAHEVAGNENPHPAGHKIGLRAYTIGAVSWKTEQTLRVQDYWMLATPDVQGF